MDPILFQDIQQIYQGLTMLSAVYCKMPESDPSKPRKSQWEKLTDYILTDMETIHDTWSLICAESRYGIPYPDNESGEKEMEKFVKRATLISSVLYKWMPLKNTAALFLRLEYYECIQLQKFKARYPDDVETWNSLIENSFKRQEIIYDIKKNLEFSSRFSDFLSQNQVEQANEL